MARVRGSLATGDALAAAPAPGAAGPAPPPGAAPPPLPPPAAAAVTGSVDADPTYRLLVDCNGLALDIEAEIDALAALARALYRPKFPELESLVPHPVDYARVVRVLGNADEPAGVPLEGLLPAATVMVVTVTAATTAGRPLGEGALEEVMATCDMILRLDADKATILSLVKDRMATTAPNLSALVGADVAAALMGAAGGLAPLAAMPACNLQVLGAKKATLAGLSSRGADTHHGFVWGCGAVQGVPPALRQRAARLVASKAALLTRVDAVGGDPAGATGAAMRADVDARLVKLQEPPPARQSKVLPVPDAGPKKKRGGRRARAAKERYGMTDMRRAANRVGFNVVEEEVLAGDELVGVGQLAGGGGGAGTRLRLQAKPAKVKLTKAQQKKYGRALAAGAGAAGGGGLVAGTASSLAFTPVQGIELEDPAARAAREAAAEAGRGGADSYFSAYGGFKSAGVGK